MNRQIEDHVDDLIIGHLDGTLTEEQELELATTLNTSQAAKQSLLSYMRMEGRLYSLGRDGFIDHQMSGPTSATDNPSEAEQQIPSAVVSGDRRRLGLLAATTSLAACAATLLLLLSNIFWTTSVNANGVLLKAQQAAAELVDRTYHVKITPNRSSSRARELNITVRGGGRFFIQPASSAYAIGNNGKDYWFTRARSPVWVTSDFHSLEPELRKNLPERWLLEVASSPNEPLLLDIAGILALIESKFDAQLVDSENESTYHVHASLKSKRPLSPQTIDFWSDVDTGVVQKASLLFSNGRGMDFELLNSARLSESWYDYAGHAEGKEVKRIATDSKRGHRTQRFETD